LRRLSRRSAGHDAEAGSRGRDAYPFIAVAKSEKEPKGRRLPRITCAALVSYALYVRLSNDVEGDAAGICGGGRARVGLVGLVALSELTPRVGSPADQSKETRGVKRNAR